MDDIPRNVRNPADPDASYNKHRGLGYMVQIMGTFAEDDGDNPRPPCPDLVTHVAMNKMTTRDGHAVEAADALHRHDRFNTILID